MIRGLKIVMIVYGAITILFSLMFFFVIEQAAEMSGFGEIADYVPYVVALLCISFIAPSVWLIVAARDPLRHINWVKFAITWTILGVVAGLYSLVRGYVDFSQAGMQIIMDIVFAVAFLALYPYRAVRRAARRRR